ncbi:SGNH/GDSL hydrolase family protein [candidate division KSB1 bacterium]|nr:SGNH/GDSL hydrolase family protein [candidate division KSB1 bacterium]
MFKRSIDYLAQINEICSANHINFSIILLPYEFQLRRENRQEYQPQQLMTEELGKLNIRVLNPATELAAVQNYRHYNLFGDGIHFSKKGHRYIFNYPKSHFFLLTNSML